MYHMKRASVRDLRADLHDRVFALRHLPQAVFNYARQLASKWSSQLDTRSLDILHVAAAVALRADSFQTFDDRQKRLAKAARLEVN
jgi:hypothetical protein